MFFKNDEGMTLIELVIVVAIVAILAAVAIPIYSGSRSRGYLTEAKQALLTIFSEQENYRAEHGAYSTSGSIPFFKNGRPKTVGEYSFNFTNLSSNEYTARATPKNPGKMVYNANNKYTGWIEIYTTAGVMTKRSQQDSNDWP